MKLFCRQVWSICCGACCHFKISS